MTWSTMVKSCDPPDFASVENFSVVPKGASGWWIVKTENKKIMAIVMSSENLVIGKR